MNKKICMDCDYLVTTTQAHNGNDKDVRPHFYCSKINADDYEIGDMRACDAFSQRTDQSHKDSKVDEELKEGAEPRNYKKKIIKKGDTLL